MDDRLARAAWSRLAEWDDAAAHWLIGQVGAERALAVAFGVSDVDDVGLTAQGALLDLERVTLDDALARWRARLPVDPERDLRSLARLGGRLVIPGDGEWPTGLADLAAVEPFCLWVRGGAGVRGRGIAVVGSRAATSYGQHVTSEIVAGCAVAGFGIVSGGAFGIDISAHRTAVATGAPTDVYLAGGVDKAYPVANAAALKRVLDEGGRWLSEYPLGAESMRHRFLARNRLIAASTRATVVVEAGWASGALKTATWAAELLRPMGAVPGPVTSAVSAGCHRLIREGKAVLVTDASEVIELAGGPPAEISKGEVTLSGDQLRVFDALSPRRARDIDEIAAAASLSTLSALAALGELDLAGVVRRDGAGWRRNASAMTARDVPA